MTSRKAQEIMGRGVDRAATRYSMGLLPGLIRMGADRAAQTLLPDATRLPVLLNTTDLQNVSGNFYFLPGHSLLGGPDKLR